MKRKPIQEDDSIDSDEIPDQSESSESESSTNEADLDKLFTETAEEKKLRLTKEYIESLKGEVEDEEAISEKLHNDYAELSGERFSYAVFTLPTSIERFRAHNRGRPTCFAIMSQNRFFSAAKDGSIIRVSTAPRAKFDIAPPSNRAVLCLACDTKRLQVAAGDDAGLVTIYDGDNGGVLLELKGHNGSVSGVVYHDNFDSLFSCSYDMTVKVWDAETGTCLSTLYGHQMEVLAIDYLGNAATVGADHTLRQWKYEQDKQLVYHGGGIKGSIDCVSMLNFKYCVTGSQDGRICFWDMSKKKPIHIVKDAHGKGNWITSICALRFHKFFASGSYDGKIRFWRISDEYKIERVCEYDLVGYANDMHFSDDEQYLGVQISQELRFGRWLPKIQEARQGVHFIKLEKLSE